MDDICCSGVLCLVWHHKSSCSSSDEWSQLAANPQTKPVNLGRESACGLPFATPTITIYYYSLLSQMADTHFTVLRWIEG